jgi:hypothetical protein
MVFHLLVRLEVDLTLSSGLTDLLPEYLGIGISAYISHRKSYVPYVRRPLLGTKCIVRAVHIVDNSYFHSKKNSSMSRKLAKIYLSDPTLFRMGMAARLLWSDGK